MEFCWEAILTAYPEMRGAELRFAALPGKARLAVPAERVASAVAPSSSTGNFFESVPKGADAYILKSVIHDWDDEQSLVIFRNCPDMGGVNEEWRYAATHYRAGGS